ncbi:agamous-like MADS-box protein AGL80 [Brassica napus]|uniref:agamous-like MADS-box protein AGL80 n=1 Tax=Brassica napus TaxID=3708 RepID=UPI0020789E79|nr:agamous-like MADS-box protein AGL80 [Brassica napus]
MGKKKMDLTYITDGRAREATFNLRKEELKQKLYELHVLCDVDTCAVIYNQYDPNPEVWQSTSEVKSVFEKFEMLSEKEKTCRSVNHEEFLHQMIEKARRKRQKLNDQNKEKYMRELMFAFLSGNMEDLSLNNDDHSELCSFIDQYLKQLVHHKNQTLNNPNFEIGQSSSMALDMNIAQTSIAEAGSSSFLVSKPPRSSELTKMWKSVIFSYRSDLPHNNFVTSIPSTSSNEEVYIPVMNQDESYHQNQNQNLEQGFVEEMMKIGEQTGFPWMEDNNRF